MGLAAQRKWQQRANRLRVALAGSKATNQIEATRLRRLFGARAAFQRALAFPSLPALIAATSTRGGRRALR